MSPFIFYFLQVGGKRCELSYRRCETPVSQMLRMIEVEIEEIEIIQKELDNEAISIQDIDNRSLWFLSRRLILLPHLILLLFTLYD